jgi:hypothetical protein
MKLLRRTFQSFLQKHSLFCVLRWGLWAVSGLATVWIDPLSQVSLLSVWLLGFTGVLNIIATAMAQPYVRVVQRRQWLLAFDVLLGVSLIWASGGHWLPFLPYALSALVLPALLGWRAALSTYLLFIVLDQIVVMQVAPAVSAPEIALRLGVPGGFMLVMTVLFRAGRRSTDGAHNQGGRLLHTRSGAAVYPRTDTGQHPLVHRSLHSGSTPVQKRTADSAFETRVPTLEMTKTTLAPAQSQTTLSRTASGTHQNRYRQAIPPTLPSLDTVLSQMADDFRQRTDIELVLSHEGKASTLPAAMRPVLIKLTQEALRNIQQHSRAHSASLTLVYKPHAVVLTVCDDGVGLLDGTHERPGMHALRLLHYRIRELDGHLDVHEATTGGVVVQGWLPLQPSSGSA